VKFGLMLRRIILLGTPLVLTVLMLPKPLRPRLPVRLARLNFGKNVRKGAEAREALVEALSAVTLRMLAATTDRANRGERRSRRYPTKRRTLRPPRLSWRRRRTDCPIRTVS
jgi:hypothetical protein